MVVTNYRNSSEEFSSDTLGMILTLVREELVENPL
jgi:hypothetical protein